ncbi:MAG: hypothetical protein GF317_04510 [Candidatus Lokiarchaeota archaeon]|nr:hypothetical protein [Candidatus Lokiarchaeota archaeon]MBD3199152.1 hypothetical protein [Candidatus Lokiarchaeota archaeon]
MQIFEAIQLSEYPYMESKEITNYREGETVGDIIAGNTNKVYLIVDHNSKRIYTYYGHRSSFKMQIYGGILADMLRKQLRLFYRVYPLNRYSEEDKEYKEIMEQKLGPGRAEEVKAADFPEQTPDNIQLDGSIIKNVKVKNAIEIIEQFPLPKGYKRRFLLIGGNVFTDDEVTKTYIPEKETENKKEKVGRLVNGFTFFDDYHYSTRLIVSQRKIQGVELFIHADEKKSTSELKIPVIYDENVSESRKIKDLENALDF